LQKFIDSFLAVVVPLHTITMGCKSFQWGKNKQNDFNEMKRNIGQTPVLALRSLQNPFEVEWNWVCHGISFDARRKACMLSL
jgi:hypothetical protein